MDRLESMSTLLAVIEAGSLSAASRRLKMPLATISRRISDLEGHLKARLLNRSTRRLTLTNAGQSYVQACRRILGEVEEAERSVSGEYTTPKGELIVTAPVVFGRLHVLPIAVDFLKAYPEIDLTLVLRDRVVDLLEERVDLGVRIGALPDSSLVAFRVGAIGRVVCASPAYLASRGAPRTPRELAGHDCITFRGPMRPDAWTFPSGEAGALVSARSRLVVDSAEAAVDAAIAGVGITCVFSYHVAEAVKAGQLALLLQAFEPPVLPVSLVYASGGLLPLKMRAFLDFVAPRLRVRLEQETAPRATKMASGEADGRR